MIRLQAYPIASVVLFMMLGFTPPALTQTQKMGAEHDHSTHQPTSICAGFAILPNGYAVLSAMDPSEMHHGTGHSQAGHQQDMNQHKAMQHGHADTMSMGEKQQASHGSHMKTTDLKMGYKHGDDIPIDKDILCVPIGEMTSTSWTSVSADQDLQVTAKSITGALAHNSRANESLWANIMRDGKPVDQAKVRVIVRMPHHDHRMPGGHGPANDPDVQGFEATAKGNGDYALPAVDFSMSGAWLFEVHIQDGETMSKAYFASEIGEE